MADGSFDVLTSPTEQALRLNAQDIADLEHSARGLREALAGIGGALRYSRLVNGAFSNYMTNCAIDDLSAIRVHSEAAVGGTTDAFRLTVATEWEMVSNTPSVGGAGVWRGSAL